MGGSAVIDDNIYSIKTYADLYARWQQSVDLSGVRYKVYFSWNTRMESWFMTIMDSDENVLIGGIRLIPNIDLLAKYKRTVSALPQGMLFIMDKEHDPITAELDRDNFGTRFLLAYTELEE
jgi:hypothetical protein